MQLPNVESISPKIEGQQQKMKQELRDIYGFTSNDKAEYATTARIFTTPNH